MRYLMLVISAPDEPDDGSAPDGEAWVAKHDASGARVLGDRLRPTEETVGVRVRKGEVLVTDGPFAETKEQIFGFDVLEAADLDEAITIAAGHPMAYRGAIELRPFWPFRGDE